MPVFVPLPPELCHLDPSQAACEPACELLVDTAVASLQRPGVLLPRVLQLFAEYLPRPFLVTSRPATELQPGTVNGLRHWHTDYDKGYGTAVKHALLVVGRPRTEFQTGFHPENTLALYDGTELHRGVPAQVAGPRWFVRATYVPEGHPLRKVPRSRG